jgi:hypothetical protein
MTKTIIQALHDGRLLKPAFKDVSTWRAWEVYLKALFGLPLEASEVEMFKAATGLEDPPAGPSRDSFCICGRRSGKSFMSAAIAVWLACSRDWAKVLGVGEQGWIFIVAVDRMQARIIRGYVEGILRASPAYSRLLRETVQDEVRLTNGVVIAIKTSSFRSVRGFTLLACIAEEMAFFRSEESANPDVELLRAVKPALETVPGSLLIGISTPYARSGALWEVFKGFYGKPGGPLVWRAPSLMMNPTLKPESVEAALAADPEGARAEWLAEFRSDISSYADPALIESLVIPGRIQIPRMEAVEYQAAVDFSGGGGRDSAAITIGHKNTEGRIIMDVLLEKRPPFNAETVASEFAETLKAYGVSQVTGDKFGGEFPAQAMAKFGIHYTAADKSSSDYFLDLLPTLTSGALELLDHKRLVSQLSNLERRSRPGGHDLIAGGPGVNDDLAVVTGILCSLQMRDLRKGRVFHAGPRLVRSSSRRISEIGKEPPKVCSDEEARLFTIGGPGLAGRKFAETPAAEKKLLDPTKGHVFFSSSGESAASSWVRRTFGLAGADVEPADKVPGEK